MDFFEALLKLNPASLAFVATFIGFFAVGAGLFIWMIESYFKKKIAKSKEATAKATAKTLAEFEKIEGLMEFIKEGPTKIVSLENNLLQAEKTIAELKHENSSLLRENVRLELKIQFLQNPHLIKELSKNSPLTEEFK